LGSLLFGSNIRIEFFIELVDFSLEEYLGLVTLELESWGQNIIFNTERSSHQTDLLRSLDRREVVLIAELIDLGKDGLFEFSVGFKSFEIIRR